MQAIPNIVATSNQCPHCKKICVQLVTQGKDYFVKSGNSPDFSVFYCETCGVGRSHPFISDKDLSAYYPDDFEAYIKKKNLLQLLQTFKYRKDLKQINRLGIAKGDSIFEVGAGRGEFLKEARDYGYKVFGIEPSTSGIKLAREEYGIDLQQGYAADIKFQSTFSLVAARHVLEHLNDAESTLEKVFTGGLKPGGLLFLKLPRLDSWESRFFGKYWMPYDLPRHRIHFTAGGIEKLLSRLGYTEVRVNTECVPFDIVRSLEFLNKYTADKRWFVTAFCMLPKIIQYGIAQFLSLGFSRFGAGRMIVTAKKPGLLD